MDTGQRIAAPDAATRLSILAETIKLVQRKVASAGCPTYTASAQPEGDTPPGRMCVALM
jgi:hypothetical protein